jgi:type II secretory pathway pseudopilin PulG
MKLDFTMKSKGHTGGSCEAFTLVELLVAMTVLVLIVAVCAELMLQSQNILKNGMQKMDADAQARLVFDRMTTDMGLMLRRNDIDYIVKDGTQVQPLNDSIAFYASAPGYFPSSPDSAPRKSVSLLGYRVNSQTYQLERLAKGTGWNNTSSGIPMAFLPATLFGTWPSIAVAGTGGVPNLNLGTDSEYQVLADGVFRFEYCYILNDGTISNVPYLTSHTAINGWRDVSSLYVAIAVMDDKSRLLVPGESANAPQLTAATAALKDFTLPTGQQSPPLTQWQTVINGAGFATLSNLPVKAASGVRIFSRTIPINNFPSDSSL